MSKKTHREVKYREADSKEHSCATCSMFIESKPPRCTLVESPIRADDVCSRWVKRS